MKSKCEHDQLNRGLPFWRERERERDREKERETEIDR